MATVRVLVLRAAGINCDEETLHAWQLAGASADLLHLNAFVESPRLLDHYQILTIPGGFSYGDDIAAGQVFARMIVDHALDDIRGWVERGGGILGICNGFQVLVKAGLLPAGRVGPGKVTVTYNESARFEARWVVLEVMTQRCAFLQTGSLLHMPVEHAEGRVIAEGDAVLSDLERDGQIALRYVDASGRAGDYPVNPNGSQGDVAGLCDPTGRVFGLMPHPDRHLDPTNHPLWTRRKPCHTADGLTVFQNAVSYWQ